MEARLNSSSSHPTCEVAHEQVAGNHAAAEVETNAGNVRLQALDDRGGRDAPVAIAPVAVAP
eukprot:2531479-Prymnesium_polylepis.1